MNCRNVKRQLQSFLDQTLDADHSVRIEHHLDFCDSCAAEFQSMKRLFSMLHSLDCPSPSDREWKVLHDTLLSQLPDNNTPRLKVYKPSYKTQFYYRLAPIQTIAALFIFSIAVFSTLYLSNNGLLPFGTSVSYPKVAAVEGTVFVSDNTSQLNPAQKNISLPPGKSIVTDSASSVEIKVDTKTALNIGRNSKCRVKKYARKKSVFSLAQGDINAKVSKRKPNELFRIETPNAFCEVIGTRFDVATQQNTFNHKQVTTLVVHEGTVKFGTKRNHIYVNAGNALAIFGDSLGIVHSENDPLIAHLIKNPNKGRLGILSHPENAQVYIDGKFSGITPLEIAITFGKHTVKIEKHFYSTVFDTLFINNYNQIQHVVHLDKNTALASVQPYADISHPLLSVSLSLMSSGRYSDAISRLKKLVNDAGISSRLKVIAYQKLSICYKNSGNLDNALAMLNHIINGQYPTSYKENALFERATLYRTSLHDPQKTITDLTLYIETYKNGIWLEEVLFTLAQLQQLSGEHKKAAASYVTFCSKFKTSSHYDKALYTLGTIYCINLSDYPKAITLFNRLNQELPQSQYKADALFWSADCLLKIGNTKKALHNFNMYLSQYPKGRWASEVKNRLHQTETARR